MAGDCVHQHLGQPTHDLASLMASGSTLQGSENRSILPTLSKEQEGEALGQVGLFS